MFDNQKFLNLHRIFLHSSRPKTCSSKARGLEEFICSTCSEQFIKFEIFQKEYTNTYHNMYSINKERFGSNGALQWRIQGGQGIEAHPPLPFYITLYTIFQSIYFTFPACFNKSIVISSLCRAP